MALTVIVFHEGTEWLYAFVIFNDTELATFVDLLVVLDELAYYFFISDLLGDVYGDRGWCL